MIEIPLWLVALAGLLLVAGAVAAMLFAQREQNNKKKKSSTQPLPQEWALTARSVFTTGERRVYRMLRETLPNHVILSKLPMVRFCQPIDLNQLRYWYDLLGTNYVSFAICAPNGRVLAAIDIDKDLSGDANAQLRRSMKIKRSVLRSCRVRYLRTAAGKLPSVAEIHALLPKASATSASATSASSGAPLGTEGPTASATAPHLATAAKLAALRAAARVAAQQVAAGKASAAVPPLAKQPAAVPVTDIPTLDDLDEMPSLLTSQSERENDALEADASPADDHAALSRARESLAHTVASRRAQRNVLWQESNVFQDSFFALDSRLDDLGTDDAAASVPGELDASDSLSPSLLADDDATQEAAAEVVEALAPAYRGSKPSVVKVTLDDMVPSERLSKKEKQGSTRDVEEARYYAGQP